VEQDERGTYLLNSKDLCMVEHLGAMRAAGISAIKIEVRAKSAFYAALTTNAYRMALSALDGDPDAGSPEDWRSLLERTSHRPFSTGFFFDHPWSPRRLRQWP
jgi:putative protease